jgi:hypothetical protein
VISTGSDTLPPAGTINGTTALTTKREFELTAWLIVMSAALLFWTVNIRVVVWPR